MAHVSLNAMAGYLGQLQPATANLNNRFLSHNDISSVLNESAAGLRGGPGPSLKSPLDSVRFGEPFPEYASGFTEPTLYSSVATMESNNLDDSSHLQTFMSEALYTNNLTQKEAAALSAAGITSCQVFCYFLSFVSLISCNILFSMRALRVFSTP